MQTGDVIHGFAVLENRPLPEIGAVMRRMEHTKSGARLIWLDRPDDNKTFSIAFKTIPQDDTGVFHILEHSVLNGSEKYPVKEPFVELLKSSMATFLNAMTFPDKTMYPVSSRNDQDFLNLIDVYMDAVLHPLSITDPHAFRQEGWHYELDSPQGELRCNGVVYNEMKGAFASPDSVMVAEMNALLFPDSCYGFESGGHPDHIPELTYENYLASHARFYHPSNSYIFLDGQIDPDAVLEKLNGFLAPYDPIDPDADIPMQGAVSPAERTCEYEIGPDEDETNKAILAEGWVFGRFDDTEKSMAASVLSRFLCGSNEAPLTKALLDAGLAEDVSFETDDGIGQLYTLLVVRNADPARKDEIWDLADSTLRDLAGGGLDKKRLHSILDRLEFTTREKDFGGMPRGLIYAIASLESWLYGGDPAQNLCYDALFAALREKIDTGWFDGFLRQAFLDNPHRARLVMLPSRTLGAEKQAAEAARLAKVKTGWDSAQIEKVMEDFAVLRDRQSQADTPEQLSCLPALRLADIPEQGAPVRQEIGSAGGVTVLHQPEDTGGITYLDLWFSLADLGLEALPAVSFLSRLLGQVATERYPVLELRSELEGKLGRFSLACSAGARPGQTESATPYLCVSAAMLDGRKQDAVSLLDEILNHTRFDDAQYIFNILRQERIALEQNVIMGGNGFGLLRAGAGCSAKGAVTETLSGITMLRWLQRTEKSFEQQGDALCRTLAGLCGRLFSRARLTLSLTGPEDRPWVDSVLAVLSDAPMGASARYPLFPAKREGFVIPAEIGFAAKAANLTGLGRTYTGADRVGAKILTYDYLWNEVRVKGGAYGVGLSVRPDGNVGLTSYRDPSPAGTLDIFGRTGQVLRDACAGGGSLDKYIVSTVSDLEPVLTPRTAGTRAAALYLNGQQPEDLQQERREILHTTPEQLLAFAEALDAVNAADRVCVIGGRAVLDACQGLDSVEPLQ